MLTKNFGGVHKSGSVLTIDKSVVPFHDRNRKGILDSIFNIELRNADDSVLQRKNKKLLKLQKAEVIAMWNKKGITVIHFKNKRTVLLLSTRHALEMLT